MNPMRRSLTILFALMLGLQSVQADTTDAQIEIGQTMAEVRKALGKPTGEMTARKQTIWVYERGEVVFDAAGKVASATLLDDYDLQKKQKERAQRDATAKKAVASAPKPAPAAAPAAAPARKSALPDDVTRLSPQWQDEAGRNVLNVQVTLGLKSFANKAELEQARTSGRVPYRITAMVIRVQDGGKPALLKDGSCRIRLFDEAGNLQLDTSASLASMCPS